MRAVFLAFRFAVLSLACCAARADSEARHGADFVRLTALPCSDSAMVGFITAAGESPDDYRAASAQFAGVPYVACWRPVFKRREVYLRYSDGDAGMVPFDDLKPIREV